MPRLVLLSTCLVLAVAANALAATTIHFQSESLSALKAQLGKHEVHAVTFHPVPTPGHAHVSMDDGRHYTAIYAAGEQGQLVALARRDGARVTVATAKSKPATTHHTLRYVAGGILIVVIVVVAAVLLVDRRRKLNA